MGFKFSSFLSANLKWRDYPFLCFTEWCMNILNERMNLIVTKAPYIIYQNLSSRPVMLKGSVKFFNECFYILNNSQLCDYTIISTLTRGFKKRICINIFEHIHGSIFNCYKIFMCNLHIHNLHKKALCLSLILKFTRRNNFQYDMFN